MIARLQHAKQLFDVGLLELRGLISGVLDVTSKLAVLAALKVDMLPVKLQPYHDQIESVGLWALAASFVLGLLVMQSKRAIPQLPLAAAPSLLDDETGR
jgi:hypothetical protein